MSIPATVTINPSQVTMAALAAQAFVATLSGFDDEEVTVVWSVDNIPGGNATVGTVDSSGNYVAPWNAGKHTVSASVAIGDTNYFANASVVISSTAPAVVVQTTVPTAASYIGALVFDSTTSTLYVYTSGGWVVA